MQRLRILSASRYCVKILPVFAIILTTVFVYRKFKSLVFNISENSSDRLYDSASNALDSSLGVFGKLLAGMMKLNGSNVGTEAGLFIFAFPPTIPGTPATTGALIFFLWTIIEMLDVAFSHWQGQLIMGTVIICIITVPLRNVLVSWHKKWNRRTSYEKQLANEYIRDIFQGNQVTQSSDICKLITNFIDE